MPVIYAKDTRQKAWRERIQCHTQAKPSMKEHVIGIISSQEQTAISHSKASESSGVSGGRCL